MATGETDVTALLPKVSVPTLVMHSRHDARVPFESGRRMAAAIPGARFVPLESRNHLILEDEFAFRRLLDEITSFVKLDPIARRTAAGRPAALLFAIPAFGDKVRRANQIARRVSRPHWQGVRPEFR